MVFDYTYSVVDIIKGLQFGKKYTSEESVLNFVFLKRPETHSLYSFQCIVYLELITKSY